MRRYRRWNARPRERGLVCSIVRTLVLLSVMGAALATGARAQEQAQEFELSWSAPAECPSAQHVRAELEQIASNSPDGLAPRLVARVAIERHDAAPAADRYAAVLGTEIAGQRGERALRAADCASLARSVTLVLALALGRGEPEPSSPVSAGAAVVSEPAREGSSTTDEADPRAAPAKDNALHSASDAPDASDPRDRELPFALQVGGGVRALLLPTPAPLLSVGLALEFGVASVELRASALSAGQSEVAANARAHFDAALLALLGCGHTGVLALCAGARTGALRGRARGVTRRGSAIAPWYAATTALALRWPEHGALQLALEGALDVSLYRPRFVVLGAGSAHRAPLLAFELTGALRTRF